MSTIIYHCYGGSHSSVTAAGIHLGLLPRERIARAGELLQVPHFDRCEIITHGHFRFIGRDQNGNEIFVLGKRTAGPDITILLHKIAELFARGKKIHPVDTTKPINLLMVVGGFFSRGLKMVSLGRPLVLLGTRLAYPSLVRLVENVQENLQKPTLIPENATSPERSALFYICPEKDPLVLLTAVLHLQPGLSRDDLLESFFLLKPKCSGRMGTVHFFGRADGYEVYLLGAGREPEITARILREVRALIGIPRDSLMVVGVNKGPASLRIASKLFLLLGRVKMLRIFAKVILADLLEHCRRERYRIRLSLKEGILD